MRVTLRARMILAALVPVALVAVSLTGMFLVRHLGDLDRALELRGQALARQAATSVEFSLFTGNREVLQSVAFGIVRTDADIAGVAVVDSLGQIMAEAGTIHRVGWPVLSEIEFRGTVADSMVFSIPVEQRSLSVDDEYSGTDFAVVAQPRRILGHVVLEISRARVLAEQYDLIFMALLTGVLGVGLGGFIALRIARSVTGPVLDATDVVTRIGNGDIAARMDIEKSGALRTLADGINAMAMRVEVTQAELMRQVEVATTELVRQRDAAERATAAKTRFLAAASHDLRQPLHALGLFISRLTRMSWPGEQQQLIGHVEESVLSLQEMLDTLLDISRLDSGGYRVELTDFDLRPLLEKIGREAAPLADEKQLDLRIRPLSVWVRSDVRLVHRVLMNLLTNALRYTERGSVLLACRRSVGKVQIQVWDTGPGIPIELQSEIFTEYVQVGNEERNREKGLGLGLAICRRIADLLATQIGIRSIPGHGSMFWFDLPLGTPQERLPNRTETEPQIIPGKVLVVDDDPLCRESAAEVIGDWGGKVLVARDADEALAICREQAKDISLVVCDVRLPGTTDGIALGGLLQQLNPAIRMVLVSAEVTAQVQAQARRAGFPILKKPVAPARLRATLLSLLETRRQAGR